MLEVEGERNQKREELAELKVIGCCPSRYPVVAPPPRPDRATVRAVERRAGTLTAEYRKKARDVDKEYGRVRVGEVGRVENKLSGYGQVRGLVIGAFGEASDGVHDLVQVVAQSRVKAVGIQEGRDTVKGEVGVLVGQIRRLLSVAAVRAQAECLLSRVKVAGGGTEAARKRRQWAGQQEMRWARERGAQEVGRRQGRNLFRRGHFLLD